MLTIHKFQIGPHITATGVVELPQEFRVLSVQVQRGVPCMWVLLDDAAPRLPTGIAIRSTGHDCTGLLNWAPAGTFQLDDGALVFHVFVRVH